MRPARKEALSEVELIVGRECNQSADRDLWSEARLLYGRRLRHDAECGQHEVHHLACWRGMNT